MDNFDYPYYGTDYGYGSGKTGESNPSQEDTVKTDTSVETLPVILGVYDGHRNIEIDVENCDLKESSKSSFSRSFSDSIPEVVYYNDSMRVSIHPLGPVDKPTGVSESDWKKLDMDKLFPYIPVKTQMVSEVIIEEPEEKGLIARLRPKTSVSSSGGGGKDKEEKHGEHEPKEMPFLDHLEELRWAILKSIIAIVIGMIAAWYLSDWFYAQVYNMGNNMEDVQMVYTKILEPIILRLQMAFAMGLVLSLPFVFYFMWSFISPGLYENEKKWVLPLIFAATGCFFIGAAIAWFGMIPYMLKFMQSFNLPGIEAMITIGPFVSLILKFTLAFGIIFELPVVTFILAKVGIVKHTFMAKYRRYAVVIIFMASAIITPTVDPISQTIMAIPLYLLYEVSIIVARFAGKKTLLG